MFNELPIVIGCESRSGNLFAHMAPKKGDDAWTTRRCSQSIGVFGFPKWSIKSDGEAAIKTLRENIRKDRTLKGEQVLWEESHNRESQTNGLVENAVGMVKRQAKTMLSGLASRFKKELSTDRPWVYYLIRHAATIINRVQIGSDGKTRYERMRGKKFIGDMFEFGESVMYKNSRAKHTGWSKQ